MASVNSDVQSTLPRTFKATDRCRWLRLTHSDRRHKMSPTLATRRCVVGALLLAACATSASFQTPASFAPSPTNRAALLSQHRPGSSGPRALRLRLSMQAPDVATKDEIKLKSIIVDEGSELQAQNFPIKPEELIAKAQSFLESRGGFGADPALLSEDFQFMGPVVGPLSKTAFQAALASVDMKTAFPDFQGQFYAFSVDPFEGNRVWYSSTQTPEP